MSGAVLAAGLALFGSGVAWAAGDNLADIAFGMLLVGVGSALIGVAV